MENHAGSIRSVSDIISSATTLEGEGFVVHWPFQPRSFDDFKPFLLLNKITTVDLASGAENVLPSSTDCTSKAVTYIPASKIPNAQKLAGSVVIKVVAGEALGAKSEINAPTPLVYLHLTLQPVAYIVHPIPSEYYAFAYVIHGEGKFGPRSQSAKEGQLVLFANDGDEVMIATNEDSKSSLSILLVADLPLSLPKMSSCQ